MSDINIVLENRDDIRVAVEEKDINVEVPVGKDGRSLHPRGEWSASVAYAYLDLVSYEGSSYVATKAVPAGTLPTNTSYWMLSAEKGEPGGAVWGNIAGDLSDQTDLADALLAKAPVILSNASGSIASFSDGSPAPVTALSVVIEPVQDLHGYDNPWPAGGEKNLFQTTATSKTESGVTWTVNADGSVTATGTATGGTTLLMGSAKVSSDMGNVAIRLTGISVETNISKNFVNLVDSNNNILQEILIAGINNNEIVFDLSPYTDAYEIIVSLKRNNNIATNGTVRVQIEKGSSYTSWTPYSNICPISGHTQAVVTRTGKNLLNRELVKGASSDTYDATKLVYLKSGYTYVVSWSSVSNATSWRLGMVLYDESGNRIFTGSDLGAGSTISKNTASQYYINASSGTLLENIVKPLVNAYAYFFLASGDIGSTSTTVNAQIELGSVPSSYESYQGQQVTIDLDGTRYGGTLNVLTGTMTVDRASVTYDGTESGWTWYATGSWRQASITLPYKAKYENIDSFYWTCNVLTPRTNRVRFDNTGNYASIISNGESAAFSAPNCETLADFKAWVGQNGIQFVYELATPLTVQLTPSQMNTLLGQNNIWADTGDVTVEYRADSKMYIDGKVAQTAKVTRQMIADSATADGKAPKSLATGDLIIVGDELRKATANIGNGSAITASNSTTATLADVIKALQ